MASHGERDAPWTARSAGLQTPRPVLRVAALAAVALALSFVVGGGLPTAMAKPAAKPRLPAMITYRADNLSLSLPKRWKVSQSSSETDAGTTHQLVAVKNPADDFSPRLNLNWGSGNVDGSVDEMLDKTLAMIGINPDSVVSRGSEPNPAAIYCIADATTSDGVAVRFGFVAYLDSASGRLLSFSMAARQKDFDANGGIALVRAVAYGLKKPFTVPRK